jgi:hypothetical protein
MRESDLSNGAETPFHPSCEVRGKHGKVAYCLECRRMALEFDGRFITLHRETADDWICGLRETLKKPFSLSPFKIFHDPRNRDGYLVLDRAQVKEAAELVETVTIIMDAETPEKGLGLRSRSP